MSIIKCKECGAEVSSKAPSCPKCGAPVKKPPIKFGCGTVILAGLLTLFLIGVFDKEDAIAPAPIPGRPDQTAHATPAPPIVQIDKSPEMQGKRQNVINELIAKHVFLKVEMPGNLPRVYVLPQFYTLDIDTKKNFLSVVYAFYFDGTNSTDIVKIQDGQSGKDVGSYHPVYGLDMD